jgi:SAM-dependent methyltransferase
MHLISSLNQQVTTAIHQMTKTMRMERMRMFLGIMKPTAQSNILDVGGLPETWLECGYRGSIVFCNLESPQRYRLDHGIPRGNIYVQADGCFLPFLNKSFDIVFSNSVIEHVSTLERQILFASEISRVGKSYWVQTPCKNFPLEPHLNFPFFQWLPYPLRELISRLWPFSWHKRWGCLALHNISKLVRSIRLLTVGDMKVLFPDSIIWKERLFGFVKSIIAYKRYS